MTYNEIVAQVADSTGLSKKMVDRIYKLYWKSVREYIKSRTLKEDLTEEEFIKLKPNVNVPSLGKFYVDFNKYKRLKEQYNS